MKEISKEIRDKILDPSIETYIAKCREYNYDNEKIEDGLKNLLKVKAITVDEYAKGMELIYEDEHYYMCSECCYWKGFDSFLTNNKWCEFYTKPELPDDYCIYAKKKE